MKPAQHALARRALVIADEAVTGFRETHQPRGDTVFAEWTCAGAVGRCHGEFKLTGGTGRFKGITGSSEFLVRSPLRVLAADVSNTRLLRVASGLAQLPRLSFEIPGQ